MFLLIAIGVSSVMVKFIRTEKYPVELSSSNFNKLIVETLLRKSKEKNCKKTLTLF